MSVAAKRNPSVEPSIGTVGQANPDKANVRTTLSPSPVNPLEQILAAEDRLRAAATESEFQHALANDLRALVGARQVLVLRKKTACRWRVTCVSSMASVERDAPLIRSIEGYIDSCAPTLAEDAVSLCYLTAAKPHDADVIDVYPFREGLWQPIRFRNGNVFAGLFFLREKPWSIAETELVQREAPVMSDIWCAIAGRRSLRVKSGRRRALLGALGATMLAALAVPVPMTTLAPVEIVARNPYLVTAPINGVIDQIHIDPNRHVKKGEPLVTFVDTELRNEYELARRNADVAISRHAQLSQAAFTDDASRHQLGIAETEMKLKRAERDYAAERLKKVVIHARKSGLLIYADKSKWLGRPVKVGERMMRIATPGEVVAQISLPVADAIVLKQGARTRLFLDADPTTALEGNIETESYHAEPDATGALVYTVRSGIAEGAFVPRIGSHGMAQLFGRDVPLGFFLFRRPIASLRQTFGF